MNLLKDNDCFIILRKRDGRIFCGWNFLDNAEPTIYGSLRAIRGAIKTNHKIMYALMDQTSITPHEKNQLLKITDGFALWSASWQTRNEWVRQIGKERYKYILDKIFNELAEIHEIELHFVTKKVHSV